VTGLSQEWKECCGIIYRLRRFDRIPVRYKACSTFAISVLRESKKSKCHKKPKRAKFLINPRYSMPAGRDQNVPSVPGRNAQDHARLGEQNFCERKEIKQSKCQTPSPRADWPRQTRMPAVMPKGEYPYRQSSKQYTAQPRRRKVCT
jgi:hypothetical protein